MLSGRDRWRVARARRRLRATRYWAGTEDLDEAARAGGQALAAATADPMLRAEITLVLAQIEQDRDNFAAAEAQFASAAMLLAPMSGPTAGRLLASALVGLGGSQRRAARYPQAIAVLDRAVALAETVARTDPRMLGAALTERGITAKEVGDHQRAADLYRWVQQLHRDHGATPADAATVEHNLAGLEYARGCYPVAELHARRALEHRRRSRRTSPTERAADLAVLAATIAAQHRYDEARGVFERTLSVYRSARPPRRYEIAVQLHGLADVEHSTGRSDEAERRYREALAIKLELLGPGHAEVGLVTANLGTLLQEQHREAEAAQCYRRALTIAEHTFGRQHPRSVRLRAKLDGLFRVEVGEPG